MNFCFLRKAFSLGEKLFQFWENLEIENSEIEKWGTENNPLEH